MKMRGYGVLFVCALCVFVLCGAAVAQDKTTKKVGKMLTIMADTAKECGNEALSIQEKFTSNVSGVVSSLSLAVEKLSSLETTAEQIKDGTPTKEQILEEIGRIKTKAEDAVKALNDTKGVLLKEEQRRTEITEKMGDVEHNITEVERAAAAMADDISAIDVVIEKAGAFKAAADEAIIIWDVSIDDLEVQDEQTMEAVAAVRTIITAVENAISSFVDDSDLKAQEVKEELSDAVKTILTPSLEGLMSLQDATQNAAEAAREARTKYSELKDKALNLTYAAKDCKEYKKKWMQVLQTLFQENSQASQKQPPSSEPPAKTFGVKEYSKGPFCPHAFLVFFFCWCVLFGM